MLNLKNKICINRIPQNRVLSKLNVIPNLTFNNMEEDDSDSDY